MSTKWARAAVVVIAVVVVGDRASIEASIRAANLGPVTIVPVADVMK